MKRLEGLLLLLTFMFVSCDNEVNPISIGEPSVAHINAKIEDTSTRASNTGWQDADRIGIMATNDKQNYYNSEYHFSDASHGFENDHGVINFEYDNFDLSFTGYYPYHSDDEINNNLVSINTAHQASESLDLLFAQAVTANNHSPEVDLNFKHMMARLVINISPLEGVTVDQLADSSTKLYLTGLKHNGTFNVVTGEAKPADNAHAVNDQEVDISSHKNAQSVTYELFYIPQELTALNIKLVSDSKEYNLELPILQSNNHKKELEAGKCYNFNISVNANLIRIDDQEVNRIQASISNWIVTKVTTSGHGADLEAYHPNNDWEDNSVIGIFAHNDIAQYFNIGFTRRNDVFTHSDGENIYYKYDNKGYDFCAYYPKVNDREIHSNVIDVKTCTGSGAYRNFSGTAVARRDYMYASSTHFNNHTRGNNLRFVHKMAKFILDLYPDGNNSFEQIASDLHDNMSRIYGLKHEGTFNLNTGELSINSNAQTVSGAFFEAKHTVVHGFFGQINRFTFYVIPQEVNEFKVQFLLDGTNRRRKEAVIEIPRNRSGVRKIEAGHVYHAEFLAQI